MRSAELQGIYDAVYLGNKRMPKLKVLLYDQADTLSDIVLGKSRQTPLDITEYVTQCSISEEEGQATSANLTLVAGDTISPYHFVGRRIVRIYYADEATLNEYGADYMCLFTGVCVGQPGYKRSRDSKEKVITVHALDRSFFYNKRNLESPGYDAGEDLGDICVDIATNGTYGMDLDREECRFGLFRSTVQHTTVALYDVPFFEALNLIGFIVDRAPSWDGDGYLCIKSVSLTRPPVRAYDNGDLFHFIDWPQTSTELYNRVRVIGLSSSLTKVVSPSQELATVSGTIGFFQDGFSRRVYYSEDRQGRAQNVYICSYNVNGQLSSIFNNEPKLKDINEFSCIVVIETPYQPWVFIVFFAVYILLMSVSILGAIPIIGGAAAGAAQLAAAVWLCAGLAIMQQIGTFEVVISGEPYKMVYKEIEGVAEWDNLKYYEIRELIIENHLVYSQALADALAFRELAREKVKQNSRKFSIPFDPFLEVTDIIELPDGTLYYLTGLSKSFQRGEPCNLEVSALMIRSGKEYNNLEGFSEY
ncbi:MAG: hypothetical protein V2A69_15890 [Pseudomonadota bacterium]